MKAMKEKEKEKERELDVKMLHDSEHQALLEEKKR